MTWLLVEPVPEPGEAPPPDLLYAALFGTDLPCTIVDQVDVDDWLHEGHGHYGDPGCGVLWTEATPRRTTAVPMNVEHTAVGLPGIELRWYFWWAGVWRDEFRNDRLVVRFGGATEDERSGARQRFSAAFATAFGVRPRFTTTFPPPLRRREPPAEHLRLIGEDPSWDQLLELAADPGTDPDLLVTVYRHPEVDRVRRSVLDDPYLATDYPGHQEHGAREYFLHRLEWLLAGNPNAGEDLLGELAGEVRNCEVLVRNTSVTPGVLLAIARMVVRRADTPVGPATIAAHPAVDGVTLEYLALHAWRPFELEAVLAAPAASPMAATIAGLRLHARDGRPVPAARVPEADALALLVATREEHALRDVAAHPGTPTALLDVVAAPCRGAELLALLAEHPNSSREALAAVARHVTWHVRHNQHVDRDLCRRAAGALRGRVPDAALPEELS